MGIRLAIGREAGRGLGAAAGCSSKTSCCRFAGGAAGLAIGIWAISALDRVVAAGSVAPTWPAFTLDARMVAFTIATSVGRRQSSLAWAPAPARDEQRRARGANRHGDGELTAPVRGRRTLWALVVGRVCARLADVRVRRRLLVQRLRSRAQHPIPASIHRTCSRSSGRGPQVKTPDDASGWHSRKRLVARMRELARA
jgi:hypothetical protein